MAMDLLRHFIAPSAATKTQQHVSIGEPEEQPTPERTTKSKDDYHTNVVHSVKDLHAARQVNPLFMLFQNNSGRKTGGSSMSGSTASKLFPFRRHPDGSKSHPCKAKFLRLQEDEDVIDHAIHVYSPPASLAPFTDDSKQNLQSRIDEKQGGSVMTTKDKRNSTTTSNRDFNSTSSASKSLWSRFKSGIHKRHHQHGSSKKNQGPVSSDPAAHTGATASTEDEDNTSETRDSHKATSGLILLETIGVKDEREEEIEVLFQRESEVSSPSDVAGDKNDGFRQASTWVDQFEIVRPNSSCFDNPFEGHNSEVFCNGEKQTVWFETIEAVDDDDANQDATFNHKAPRVKGDPQAMQPVGKVEHEDFSEDSSEDFGQDFGQDFDVDNKALQQPGDDQAFWCEKIETTYAGWNTTDGRQQDQQEHRDNETPNSFSQLEEQGWFEDQFDDSSSKEGFLVSSPHKYDMSLFASKGKERKGCDRDFETKSVTEAEWDTKLIPLANQMLQPVPSMGERTTTTEDPLLAIAPEEREPPATVSATAEPLTFRQPQEQGDTSMQPDFPEMSDVDPFVLSDKPSEVTETIEIETSVDGIRLLKPNGHAIGVDGFETTSTRRLPQPQDSTHDLGKNDTLSGYRAGIDSRGDVGQGISDHCQGQAFLIERRTVPFLLEDTQ